MSCLHYWEAIKIASFIYKYGKQNFKNFYAFNRSEFWFKHGKIPILYIFSLHMYEGNTLTHWFIISALSYTSSILLWVSLGALFSFSLVSLSIPEPIANSGDVNQLS